MANLNRKTTTTTKTKNNDIEYIILRKNAEILGLDIPSLKLVENMLVDKNTTVKEKTLFFIKCIDDINKSIKGVNSEGYVNTADLSLYPIISEGLNKFLMPEKALSLDELKSKSKSKSKSKFNKDEAIEEINLIEKVQVGEVKVSIDECKDLYKWIYNLIYIKLYTYNEFLLKNLLLNKDENKDLIVDVKVISKDLFKKIDPTIRVKLVRRGLNVLRNTYTGFDSEYKFVENGFNKLISIQLALSSRIILKLPFVKPYEFSSLETSNDKIYKIKKSSSSLDYDEILKKINESIIYFRNLNFYTYDTSINKLINGLKNLEFKSKSSELRSIQKDDYIYFIFGLKGIKKWIRFFKDNEEISFNNLVSISNKLTKSDLNNEIERIRDILVNIYKESSEGSETSEGSESLESLESLENKEMGVIKQTLEGSKNSEIAEITEVTENLENLENLKIIENSKITENSEGLVDLENLENLEKIESTETTGEIESDSVLNILGLDLNDYETSLESKVGSKDSEDVESESEFKNSEIEVKNSEVKNSEIEDIEDIEDIEVIKNKEIEVFKEIKKTYNQSFTSEKVSVRFINYNYFIGHLTNADLSILSDMNELKLKLDIVNKSFVTRTKPILIDNTNVIIRDTMLLAPGGRKSLKVIGSMYKLNKVDLSEYYINNMDLLLIDDREKFKEYAHRDALITLTHGLYMENFNFCIGDLGIPLTLSVLSNRFLKKFWEDRGYPGYQLSPNYQLSNVSKTMTPKGLLATQDIGLKLSLFIGNYKGGRNESFMYGFETKDTWFDYDLISAYTTAMSALGTPDYNKATIISERDFKRLPNREQIFSYTIINTIFEFPENTKYPSIACYTDENTTVYPLKGTSLITGAEYFVASKQFCKFNIKEIFYIPFKWKLSNNELILNNPPFKDCIKELQGLRRQFPKNSIENLLYKELGNSLYGLTVQGINNKVKFDTKTNSMKRMEGSDISNPIIASWITSFIRSIISELLHYINILNGSVISVTTDGFICNIENLEEKVFKYSGKQHTLLKEYKKLRFDLSNNPICLEVKNSDPIKELFSWCTRGQLSASSNLVAATGFQRSDSLEVIQDKFLDVFNKPDKSLYFIQKTLRNAKDIYKNGGHVTPVYRDQIYRLLFDNKRVIIDNKIDSTLDPNSKNILDSKPFTTAELSNLFRFLSNYSKDGIYSKSLGSSFNNNYKNQSEIIIRNFLKVLLNNELNLNYKHFKNYDSIINFIIQFKPENNFKITPNYLAQLKRRGNFIKIPPSPELDRFIDYVKKTFPNFDDKGFRK